MSDVVIHRPMYIVNTLLKDNKITKLSHKRSSFVYGIQEKKKTKNSFI